MNVRALVPALLFAGAAGAAPTATCVDVQGPEAEAVRRLVISELDRHPTHRAATNGEECLSHLRVELIEVGGERYVTGRINTQVPHREAVTEDLDDAVSQLLRIVLHSDPMRLEDPARDDWLRRQKALFRRRGVTLYGVEAFEVAGGVDGRFTALPGVALTVRREVDQWHVGVRLAGAYDPGDGDDLRMTAHVAAQLELAVFASDVAPTTVYGAVLLGLEHQRFQGPSPVADGARRVATATGFGVGLRGGVELFRANEARMQLFVQANVPAFTASDDEGEVVDAWVPTLCAGVGAIF